MHGSPPAGPLRSIKTTTSAGFTEFTGSYDYSDGKLSGTYSDGKAWKETYSVQVTKTTLKLTE